MKKLQLLFLLSIFLFAYGCSKKEEAGEQKSSSYRSGSFLTNVHAPTSGSDSIYFTADSSHLALQLFSPLGGSNHVVVHDMTANTNLYNGNVTTNDEYVTGFTPGNNYYVRVYSGQGGMMSNFSYVSSSYRNSAQTPTPFTGYTQYYNTTGTQGPSDGVVIIILEEPAMGSKKGK